MLVVRLVKAVLVIAVLCVTAIFSNRRCCVKSVGQTDHLLVETPPVHRPHRDQDLAVLLEEYRELQNEKRSYFQSANTLIAGLVAGSVTALGILLPKARQDFLWLLPPVQLMLIFGYGMLISLGQKLSLHLALLEKRINDAAESGQLLTWEQSWYEPVSSPFASLRQMLRNPTARVTGVFQGTITIALGIEVGLIAADLPMSWSPREKTAYLVTVSLMLAYAALQSLSMPHELRKHYKRESSDSRSMT